MNALHIADGLSLPLDLVTEPIGVLANRGRGKSYTTHVLVEEIHDAGVPVVVLDVKGDWWGLRSTADGKPDGLPFYIFGGNEEHRDVPLEPTAGELLADLVVNERVSVVLDLSHMSKTKARSFTVAFAERLYHRNRDPLFVVVDEADVLIPQRATAETARLLGAMEDIAKRGRGRGIGMAVVTQRPQEVAKSVLDLMDTLILLGMTGPRSLKSINDWISGHVDEDTTAGTVMASLPSLPVGTAWVWSPMHHLLERVNVRTIRTFDSHVTPKPGEKRVTPKGRAALDLTTLGEQIQSTVEKAKADDPKVLKARIRELERDAAGADRTVEVTVEVPVLTDEVVAKLEATFDRLSLAVTEWAEELRSSNALIDQVVDQTHSIRALLRHGQQRPGPSSLPSRPRANPGARPSAAPRARREPSPRASTATAGQGALPKAQRLILTALAQHGPQDKIALAILTGYSHKGGGFNNPLGALRSAGYITGRNVTPIAITDEGLDALGDFEPLPTGRALLEWWLPQLNKAGKAIVGALDDLGPLEKVDLAAAAGYDPNGGGFNNPIGHMRTLGIITPRNVSPIALAPEMCD